MLHLLEANPALAVFAGHQRLELDSTLFSPVQVVWRILVVILHRDRDKEKVTPSALTSQLMN